MNLHIGIRHGISIMSKSKIFGVDHRGSCICRCILFLSGERRRKRVSGVRRLD